ncbi:MAG: hypothetical protein UBAL2_80490169a [Leptospirillum rubarum]|uniref:High potential iron-sulfur proteins family profile domain-containing protein n=2 Tax=Leptospirillum sp. Group II TaxID=261385 RepID=B6ARR8_9BACT|nr:MAG: hypothetical protein UBAL2_80490169a [Leptospirillum rubarum]EDZ38164.1 MAG: Hypothetical protein CGL2_09490001 [Leptospirillum sp. Group II '5-way CG']
MSPHNRPRGLDPILNRNSGLYPLLTRTGETLADPPAHKVDKKTALYQTHPEEGKMCMNCQHFLPPKGMSSHMMGDEMNMEGMNGSMGMGGMMSGACTIVAGSISPMGYCRFYLKRS